MRRANNSTAECGTGTHLTNELLKDEREGMAEQRDSLGVFAGGGGVLIKSCEMTQYGGIYYANKISFI